MFARFKQLFNPKNKDLRKRILFTFVVLFIFKLGTTIVVPGIDKESLGTNNLGFLELINAMGGGALEQFSIFALGVMPYITASIVVQLLQMDIIPYFAELSKQGGTGRTKLNQITRYVGILFAFVQGYAMSIAFLGSSMGTIGYLKVALIMTAGTAFLLWLGDQVTQKGLGNGETAIFPILIFKVKEGVNYNPGDPNYDLFKLAIECSSKRLFPNFSFMDSSFNKPYYKGDYNTEVGYMGCRTRVIGNVVDEDKAVTPGRGNLSFTSINLPRLGIKHGIVRNDETDMKGFYEELGELMDLVKDQLLERFEIQCNKRLYNFPFLLGQGIWIDSDKLKPNDRLRKILKHGTLSIGFIGLAECLKALIGKHHGESEEAQKLGLEIIEFMRNKCDEYAKEYKLNFTLLATPAEGLSGRFINIDKAVYGKIKGVTDREYYTNSFHVPVYYNISIVNKIKKEGPYHKYTNAGHISYIELDGDTTNNLEAFEKIIRLMYENDMGYAAINHPVDRDPVCGYVGVIGDTCPGCGRKAYEGVPIERVNDYKNSCNC